MTAYEIISALFAGGAFVISIIALYKANGSAIKANDIAMGNIELYMGERIANTKEKVESASINLGILLSKEERTPSEEKILAIYQKAFYSAVENNLNAYEEICAKYIDKKVDQTRFEKMYKAEIRQLVECSDLKEYFDGVTSKYKAILKVYSNWENLEK